MFFRLFQPEFWQKTQTPIFLDLKSRWTQNSCETSDQSEFKITTFEKCSSQMKKGRRQNNLGASVDMLYYILLWRDSDLNPRGKFWLRDIESSIISLLLGVWLKSMYRSSAGTPFLWNRKDIWAGFGQVDSTEKKGFRSIWGQCSHVFMSKKEV